MSYIEQGTHKRFNPASMLVATAVNGGLLVAFLTMAPDIIGDSIYVPTVLSEVDDTPKIDPVKPDKPLVIRETAVPTFVPRPDITLPPIDLAPLDPPDPMGGGGSDLTPPRDLDPPADLTPKPFVDARPDKRFAHLLQPSYPPSMIRAEMEGVAVVRVLVGVDGRVKAVEPVRADDEAFMAVTRDQALRKWRFTPATRGGDPVETWREITVRFQLPD